jgi:hypothetical protein
VRCGRGDGCRCAAIEAAWAEGTRLSLDDAVAYAIRSRGTRGRPPTGWNSLIELAMLATARR